MHPYLLRKIISYVYPDYFTLATLTMLNKSWYSYIWNKYNFQVQYLQHIINLDIVRDENEHQVLYKLCRLGCQVIAFDPQVERIGLYNAVYHDLDYFRENFISKLPMIYYHNEKFIPEENNWNLENFSDHQPKPCKIPPFGIGQKRGKIYHYDDGLDCCYRHRGRQKRAKKI